MKVEKIDLEKYEYSLPTKVKFWFGEEQSQGITQQPFNNPFITYLAEQLLLLGTKGLLIVGSGQAVSSSNLSYLITQFHTLGVEVVPVIGVKPGCEFNQIQSIAKSIAVSGKSWVLAIGGGSVIDAGKLLSVYEEGIPLIAKYSSVKEIQEQINSALNIPVIAVPTCLGSGSEVSSLVDVFSEQDIVKIPVVSDKLAPYLAIINTKLCQTAPCSIQAAAMMDAFCHLLDPYLSAGREISIYEGVTTELCNQLLDLSNRIINRAFTDLDFMRLAWISHLAVSPGLGRSFDDSILHRIEHIVSPYLGLSHGQGLALLLPKFLREIRKQSSESWPRIARVFINIFKEIAPPDLLFQQWVDQLPLGPLSVQFSEKQIIELTDKILLYFGYDGVLPGTLNFDQTHIRSILGECNDFSFG